MDPNLIQRRTNSIHKISLALLSGCSAVTVSRCQDSKEMNYFCLGSLIGFLFHSDSIAVLWTALNLRLPLAILHLTLLKVIHVPHQISLHVLFGENASMLEANASTSSISNKVNSSHSKKQKNNISESESSRISPITCRPGIGSFRMLFSLLSQLVLLYRSSVLPKRRVYAMIVLQLFLGKIQIASDRTQIAVLTCGIAECIQLRLKVRHTVHE